jgi:TctA family transporter
MSKFGFEPAPMILGVVLGSRMEESLRQAMIISSGDFSIFITRPISAALLLLAALMVVIVAMPNVSKRRKEIFVEED